MKNSALHEALALVGLCSVQCLPCSCCWCTHPAETCSSCERSQHNLKKQQDRNTASVLHQIQRTAYTDTTPAASGLSTGGNKSFVAQTQLKRTRWALSCSPFCLCGKQMGGGGVSAVQHRYQSVLERHMKERGPPKIPLNYWNGRRLVKDNNPSAWLHVLSVATEALALGLGRPNKWGDHYAKSDLRASQVGRARLMGTISTWTTMQKIEHRGERVQRWSGVHAACWQYHGQREREKLAGEQ